LDRLTGLSDPVGDPSRFLQGLCIALSEDPGEGGCVTCKY